MTLPFFTAGQSLLSKTPKEQYTNQLQATLDADFRNSSDYYLIDEEVLPLGSETYESIYVRINRLINPSTGTNVEEDFKKILFEEINHGVALGRMFNFGDNYWITLNVSSINSLTQTAMVRRCNNSLRWIDELTGALYEVPCVLDYLVNENRDYATAGSTIVVPSGMLQCIVQLNSKTMTIAPNQRFLFGRTGQWTAFRVEGGGINNFNNTQTMDNTSAGYIRLSMVVDFLNEETDDLVNGIANTVTNAYVLTLSDNVITGEVGNSVQLSATLTLNGDTVSRNLVWSSSNTTVATVDASGNVTFVSDGTATITCKLENNDVINDTCAVTVTSVPTDVYQVVISPSDNYVLEGLTATWSVYLYKNGVQQADTFTFALNANTVPSTNYIYTEIDGNSFSIQNVEMFLTDVLEVTCTSGIYNRTLSISLRGAW